MSVLCNPGGRTGDNAEQLTSESAAKDFGEMIGTKMAGSMFDSLTETWPYFNPVLAATPKLRKRSIEAALVAIEDLCHKKMKSIDSEACRFIH